MSEYFKSRATPTIVARRSPVRTRASGFARRSDRCPAKSRRARVSLITTDPVSISSSQRPLDERHPEHRAKARRDRADRRFTCGAKRRRQHGLAFLEHDHGRFTAGGQGGFADAGQRLCLREQRRCEVVARLLLAILRAPKIDLHRQDLIGREAARIPGHLPHALEHQAGAGEQHDRQRDLRRGHDAAGNQARGATPTRCGRLPSGPRGRW